MNASGQSGPGPQHPEHLAVCFKIIRKKCVCPQIELTVQHRAMISAGDKSLALSSSEPCEQTVAPASHGPRGGGGTSEGSLPW